MNERQLFEAIGQVDDDLILAADRPAVRRRKMAEVLREPWLRGLLRTLKAEKSYSPYYLPCLWRSRLLLNALYCSKFHGKSWLFGKLDWAGYYLFLGKRRR